MRGPAKRLIVSGLDRALGAAGVPGADVPLARRDVVDWGFARARAARHRLGIVGGLAVVVTRPARAELRAVDVPTAGPAEVTVEVLASAISPGTERAQWLRLPNARPPLPFAPGYCGAGRVLCVGAGASGVTPGDLVAVLRAPHASVVTVPASWAVAVPPAVSAEDAALAYLAVIAGYGVRRAGAVAGEPVCVIGAGPVGALAHRLVMLEAPGPVTVVASSRRREDVAMRAGAARFLTTADGTADVEAAMVIEATGDPAALETAVAAARQGATVVLLGSPRGPTSLASLAAAQRKGLQVVGAHVSALATEATLTSTDPFREIAGRFLDAVAAGRVEVEDIAGEAVDPREIGLAYRRLGRGELAAAHLDWSRLPRAERVRTRRLISPPRVRPRAVSLDAPEPAGARATGAPLRFAVLGCGDIGFTNARAIAAADGAELAVAFDVVAELAGAAVEQFGGAVASSLSEALDPGRADAVFISTPHDLHVPLAVQAAEAGLHVVVEKPLAADLVGAEEAAAAAAAAGVELSVCFSFRYDAGVRLARRLVEAGALGPLRGATVLFHADKPPSYWLGGFSGRATSDWRMSRARAGGGVLIMNLTHYVDLLRHVAGAEPAWVAGTARTDEGAEVEDAVALSVGFRGGAIGTFAGSASTRGTPDSRFEIWGETGTLRLTPDPAIYTERAVDGVPVGQWCRLAPGAHEDERRVFVERFAQAVRDGRSPDVTPGDALAVQAFIEAAYRAVESGDKVVLGGHEP
jgi:2-desacetyl-2-hydroxyethyl bacteriochlorophyllide A dehydrogenase